MFQSTCPHGARPGFLYLSQNKKEFQSTCPHGARPGHFHTRSGRYCFNPRAHTGHDYLSQNKVRSQNMFQSTCPHGARLRTIALSAIPRTRFNPRAHTGHDLYILSERELKYCFNPRAHTGHDVDFSSTTGQPALFQSTCPHGARLLFCNNLLCNTKESCNR